MQPYRTTHNTHCKNCGKPLKKTHSITQYVFCSTDCYHKSRTRPLAESLWSKVAIGSPDECWPFMGARAFGYGRIGHSSMGHMAHRVAWVLTKGEIPDGLFVLHKCDNPPCCNPAHLFLGTQKDNLKDMSTKGRRKGGSPPGIKNHSARLTEADVITIRATYIKKRGNLIKMAAKYGICPTHLRCIIKRQAWKHIP